MFDIVAIAAVLITQFICWRNIFFSLLFSVWVHCNIIFVVQKTFFIQNECLIGALRPLAEKCTQSEYFTVSKGVFNFNVLALAVSQILGGPKIQMYIRRPCVLSTWNDAYMRIAVVTASASTLP